MQKIQRRVNIEYAIAQGFCLMGFCIAISFAAVFLQFRGYTNSQLGLIMAGGNVAGFLLAPALASVLDRSEKLTVFHCIWGLLFTQLTLMVLFILIPGRSPVISAGYCLYMAAVTTVTPILTQVRFELELRCGHINYGMARGVGSLAFAPTSMLLGKLSARFSPAVLPYAAVTAIILQFIIMLILCIQHSRLRSADYKDVGEKKQAESLLNFIRKNRRFCIMMLGVAMLYFSNNIYTNFLINVVKNVGGNVADMGSISAFTALLEIPTMFLYDKMLQRIKCPTTIRISALAYPLRALATFLAPSILTLYAANLLQILSYALITPALVRYVDLYIPHEDSAKGQAFAFTMGTLASIFSTSLGGLMYDYMSVSGALFVAFTISLAGSFITYKFCET